MEKVNKIRVRYAPSPTGYLHIGGARSALFNYLYAKHNNGDFVVRIEDTDLARNIPGAEESQINDLEWLGIVDDESPYRPNPKYAPYRQTEKLEIYRRFAAELVQKGFAYECFCTEEELEKSKEEQLANGISSPRYDRRCLYLSEEEKQKLRAQGLIPTIRLKMPDNECIEFDDMVRGKMKFNSGDIGDFVILKSNGIPTYNFAVVIDDHLMNITHVLRGEEHLSNTPKQIQIYRYFGWDVPRFAHLSIIVNEHGKKLSKRDNDIRQFISEYRDLGYPADAIFNFLFLLGFSPLGEQEIFSKDEAIQLFDIAHLSNAPSMFDQKKLDWMSASYIKAMSDDEYLRFVKQFLDDKYLSFDLQTINFLLLLFKEQIHRGSDINYLMEEVLSVADFDQEVIDYLQKETSVNVINSFVEEIRNLSSLNKDMISEAFKKVSAKLSLKGKDLYMPIRLKLTGRYHGLEIYNIVIALGKETTIERLKK